MHIIQSYNTFGGDRLTAGFSTRRAMLAYLATSYTAHKSIASQYTMYTDAHGYDIIKSVIAVDDITVIDFPIIRHDTIIFAGKYHAQQLHTAPYLHVDIDATLFAMPDKADVYCERSRYANLGREASLLNIDCTDISCIPCSAIVGFSDIAFKDAYIAEIYARIASLAESTIMSYEMCWNVEEVLLQRMILDQQKSIAVCPDSHHLYHPSPSKYR